MDVQMQLHKRTSSITRSHISAARDRSDAELSERSTSGPCLHSRETSIFSGDAVPPASITSSAYVAVVPTPTTPTQQQQQQRHHHHHRQTSMVSYSRDGDPLEASGDGCIIVADDVRQHKLVASSSSSPTIIAMDLGTTTGDADASTCFSFNPSGAIPAWSWWLLTAMIIFAGISAAILIRASIIRPGAIVMGDDGDDDDAHVVGGVIGHFAAAHCPSLGMLNATSFGYVEWLPHCPTVARGRTYPCASSIDCLTLTSQCAPRETLLRMSCDVHDDAQGRVCSMILADVVRPPPAADAINGVCVQPQTRCLVCPINAPNNAPSELRCSLKEERCNLIA